MKDVLIALAGNQNCGKTTLFNRQQPACGEFSRSNRGKENGADQIV